MARARRDAAAQNASIEARARALPTPLIEKCRELREPCGFEGQFLARRAATRCEHVMTQNLHKTLAMRSALIVVLLIAAAQMAACTNEAGKKFLAENAGKPGAQSAF